MSIVEKLYSIVRIALLIWFECLIEASLVLTTLVRLNVQCSWPSYIYVFAVPLEMDGSRIFQASFGCDRLKVVVAEMQLLIASFFVMLMMLQVGKPDCDSDMCILLSKCYL